MTLVNGNGAPLKKPVSPPAPNIAVGVPRPIYDLAYFLMKAVNPMCDYGSPLTFQRLDDKGKMVQTTYVPVEEKPALPTAPPAK